MNIEQGHLEKKNIVQYPYHTTFCIKKMDQARSNLEEKKARI